MIRGTKFDKVIMGQNVDLLAQSPTTSGTFTPALPPKQPLPMYQRGVAAPAPNVRTPFGFVPMQDKPNTMASEDINADKITNPAKMAFDAMKPVGPGATVFPTFPLKYC
jgi:hypothetical protein